MTADIEVTDYDGSAVSAVNRDRAGQRVDTDYLIVGAGALGMTFADQLLTDTDASIVIVDRHHMPGGHWNDAYPFVRLHQPSAFYGAGSRQLGSNRIEAVGFNRGYFELASAAEVLSYFDALMRERFLPSGRVRYFPMSEYDNAGQMRSLLSGETRDVAVGKKIVDASYCQTSVPATHTRGYQVADNVRVVAPNALPTIAPAHRRFTIVGAGKTAMDVGVWLLQSGAQPQAIRWIVPRDSWLINRETTQPGDEFYHRFMAARAAQMEAAAEASAVEDLFLRLERCGQMLRIDPSVMPTMYRSATISAGEVEALRCIKNVVRLGRVRRIERGAVILESGEVETAAEELYVDCTASALGRRPTRPVFEDGRITIQTVRAALFCLSAASIAHVEARFDDDALKNRLCPPLALPNSCEDWLPMTLGELRVQKQWAEDPALRQWVSEHRLTGSNLRSKRTDGPLDPESKAIRERLSLAIPRAIANLERLMAL
jgi:hypothetical protein